MTKAPASMHKQQTHAQIWALLPWYANKTLTPDEHAQVDAHLAECTHCRVELTRYQSLATDVRQQVEDAPYQASMAKFNQLMDRITQNESVDSQQAPRNAPVKPSLFTRIGDWLTELSHSAPSVRWTMAAQGALLVVLAVTVAITVSPPPEQTLFQTFSTPQLVTGDIRLVIDSTTQEKHLRELLIAIEGTIVQGPSTMGVYTIALANPISRDNALQLLRNDKAVKLAEPVSP